MGDDAHQESQTAQDTPRTAELRQFVEELAARLAAVEAQRVRAQRMADLLDSAGGPEPPLVPPRKPKRDRHGMHIVRGMVLPLGMVLHWLLRARWHRVLAYTAAFTTMAAAGSSLAPDLMRAPPARAAVVRPHHAEAHHRRPDAGRVTVPVPGRRKRRRLEHDETVSPRPRVTASAPPSPDPSPSATPDPDPAPSVTLPPVPSPLPTCTWLTGNHCHDGDGLGDAAGVLGALAGQS